MSFRRPVPARHALTLVACIAALMPAQVLAADPGASAAPRWDAVVAAGRAVPADAVELGVVEPGIVTTVATFGDEVAAGEPILTLDPALQEAQLTQATAALDGAVAAAAQADAGAERADAAVDAATAAVTQLTAQLDAAKAGVTRAQAAVDQAVAARDDLPLSASNALERQLKAAVEVAQAAVDEAKAGRDAAQAALDRSGAELRGAIAAKTGAEQAAVAAAAEVRRAEGGVASAEAALVGRSVIAPFSGTVAWVGIRAGEYAAPGMPIVRFADPSAWTFETTDVGADEAARVRPGDPATVTVDDLFDIRIPAVVREVALFGEEGPGGVTYRVVLDATGPVPSEVRWNAVVTIVIAPGGEAPAG